MSTADTIDDVLEYLGMALQAFKWVAASGVLPQSQAFLIAGDVVRVSAVLIEAIQGQIERLQEMKSTGRELTPEEWESLRIDLRGLEDRLIGILNSNPA